MTIKRRLKDRTIVNVTMEDKDEKIKRLYSLVKELTDLLSQFSGYDRAIAPCNSYQCYG